MAQLHDMKHQQDTESYMYTKDTSWKKELTVEAGSLLRLRTVVAEVLQVITWIIPLQFMDQTEKDF